MARLIAGGVLALLIHGIGAAAQQPLPRILPGSDGSVRYYIADGLQRAKYVTGDEDFVRWAFAEWERASEGAIRFRPSGNEGEATVRVYWLPWNRKVRNVGETRRYLSLQRLIADIFLHPDPRGMGPVFEQAIKQDPMLRNVIVQFAALHEVGHALGLSSSTNPQDVMAERRTVSLQSVRALRKQVPDRPSLEKAAWLSPADVKRIRALYPARP